MENQGRSFLKILDFGIELEMAECQISRSESLEEILSETFKKLLGKMLRGKSLIQMTGLKRF
jgi:hypothetical protein